MKSYRKELWFNAPARMHFTNITPDVRECLAESEFFSLFGGDCIQKKITDLFYCNSNTN